MESRGTFCLLVRDFALSTLCFAFELGMDFVQHGFCRYGDRDRRGTDAGVLRYYAADVSHD